VQIRKAVQQKWVQTGALDRWPQARPGSSAWSNQQRSRSSYCTSGTSSTRRFWARPSSVALVATK
jgi:hypothetical protein